jgi:hypothetical protein
MLIKGVRGVYHAKYTHDPFHLVEIADLGFQSRQETERGLPRRFITFFNRPLFPDFSFDLFRCFATGAMSGQKHEIPRSHRGDKVGYWPGWRWQGKSEFLQPLLRIRRLLG